MNELKTSAEWAKECPYEILDADGWDRGNFDYSWHVELITYAEFEMRAMYSTIIPRINAKVDKDIQAISGFFQIVRNYTGMKNLNDHV